MIRGTTALLAAIAIVVLFAGWSSARSPETQQSGASVSGASGAAPAFVQANRKYIVRWQPGDSEVYSVLEVRGAWARGRRDPGSAAQEGAPAVDVWLNLSQAITITEQR